MCGWMGKAQLQLLIAESVVGTVGLLKVAPYQLQASAPLHGFSLSELLPSLFKAFLTVSLGS